MKEKQHNINRREFLRRLGLGAGSAFALMTLEPFSVLAREQQMKQAENKMTYRVQHGSGRQVSLLGFGMM
ncbi:MAG: hypothetical protein IKR29_04280, partial [Bacteroidales bacterium]|nr:hypothetical protein [Bacteroidales bacterium]